MCGLYLKRVYPKTIDKNNSGKFLGACMSTSTNVQSDIIDINIIINVDGETVEESESEKLLGVIVNNSSTWQ